MKKASPRAFIIGIPRRVRILPIRHLYIRVGNVESFGNHVD